MLRLRVPPLFLEFLIITLSIGTPHANAQKTQNAKIPELTAEIVKARAYTSQFVVLAKKSFEENSPEYNAAYKLYADAYRDYSGWNAYLTAAITQGKAKDITTDSTYDKYSADAVKSAATFVNYVDSNTPGQQKAVVTILSSLADLGLKLWLGISNKRASDRATLATNFCSMTYWQSWNEIKDGSAPAANKAACNIAKPSSDNSNAYKPKTAKS